MEHGLVPPEDETANISSTNTPAPDTQEPFSYPYQRLELGFGLAALAFGLSLTFFPMGNHQLPLGVLLKWLGVALLVQGLIRDSVLLLFHRRQMNPKQGRRGMLICIESTLGVGLIGLYFLLNAGEGQPFLNLGTRELILLFSLTWLFGYFSRDWVLELRKDPNHLNLVFGLPKSKNETSSTQ